MEIAILLTCHNRRKKTCECLQSLKKAHEAYNKLTKEKIDIQIFLTDDGCTDGTADAVREIYSSNSVLHILRGDGNLFWAGGMRTAWEAAKRYKDSWDYYLLLNDDTDILNNLFDELFSTICYSQVHFGKVGLISGLTSAKDNHEKITYGGSVWDNRIKAIQHRVIPSGEPLLCDMTNANILLVHRSVVNKIGILYHGYIHAHADYDYSDHARRSGFPVLLTANVCGRCDYDHKSRIEEKNYIVNMSLMERKRYFSNPLHSSKDYLLYIKRNMPIRYPIVAVGRFLNLYFPRIYYSIFGRLG